MAITEVDFASLNVGVLTTNNAGWEVGGRNSAGSESEWSVVQSGDYLDGKAIKMERTLRYPFVMWTDGPSALLEASILMRIKLDSGASLGCGIKAEYTGATTYGYLNGAFMREPNEAYQLANGYVGSSVITGAGNSLFGTIEPDTWYWFRFKYVDLNTEWYAKYWKFGESEPAYLSAAGNVTNEDRTGFFALYNGTFPAVGTEIAYTDYIAISDDPSIDPVVPNDPPVKPVISIDSRTDTSVSLTGTTFNDPDELDTHAASQWQVDVLGGDFSSPVDDSGVDGVNLTSYSTASVLSPITRYIARVRYRDNHDNWSPWSESVEFVTQPGNAAPNRPSLTLTEGTTSVQLFSSGFIDPEGDSHEASQWQVDAAVGDFSTPVLDSGEDTTNLLSYETVGTLDPTVEYAARVRHKDDQGNWSEWSNAVDFFLQGGWKREGQPSTFWTEHDDPDAAF